MKKFIEINDEATNILCNLETLDGNMFFLSELIDDLERHPEVAASFVKNGIVQKKLNAIYTLFNHSLRSIQESEKNITKITEEEPSNEDGEANADK